MKVNRISVSLKEIRGLNELNNGKKGISVLLKKKMELNMNQQIEKNQYEVE